MKTEIVPFKVEHALKILENPRTQDLSLVHLEGRERVLELYEKSGPCFTLFVDGMPIGCGGVVLGDWKRGQAWAILSCSFVKHKLSAVRAMKHGLEGIIMEHGLKRVQILVDPAFEIGKRFARHLGFVEEGILRQYGPNGEDFAMFGRIS